MSTLYLKLWKRTFREKVHRYFAKTRIKLVLRNNKTLPKMVWDRILTYKYMLLFHT